LADKDPKAPARPPRSWVGRVAWFAALWLAGVAVLGVVAYGIKLVIL